MAPEKGFLVDENIDERALLKKFQHEHLSKYPEPCESTMKGAKKAPKLLAFFGAFRS